MNYGAVIHQSFDRFCYPVDENILSVNLQTGKDIEKVVLVWGDPFDVRHNDGGWEWNCHRVELNEYREMQNSFLWCTKIVPPFKRVRYYYEIYCGSEMKILLEEGFVTPEELKANPDKLMFIYAWMNKADISDVPEWAKKTVWYQIFPSRFAHGENPHQTEEILPWESPDKELTRESGNELKYGGNIRGIIDHLDYLKDLGVSGLYLNPINLSSSQHKYNTDDYWKIDPNFGSAEDVKEMVSRAHGLGMRVMFDGVFNHSGWEFPIWQDVWKNREKSKYKDWFIVNDFNFDEKPGKNARDGKFYSFAFVDYMPKLNTNNPEVRKYICDLVSFWIKEYDIDGIRLDVANEISHELCRDMRRAFLNIKGDFFIVGEIWNNAMPFLNGDQYDSVINYPLRSAILSFALDKKLSVKEFEWQINRCMTMYYQQNVSVMLNQMDSHDVMRILNRSNGDMDLAMMQTALLFMFPGSACIYYGTEVMMAGGDDPDNRRCMPWKEISEGKYDDRLEFFKSVLALRSSNACTSLNVSFEYDSMDLKGNGRVVNLVRKSDDGKETVKGIFNFGENPVEISCSEKVLVKHKVEISQDVFKVEPKGMIILAS